MKIIRAILFKFLGEEKYYRLISYFYIKLIDNGFLKNQYPEIFYLEKIIKPGFCCVDIGANMGYYSYFLSKHAGSSGKVISVEPVKLFNKIWESNMNFEGLKNFSLYSIALGEKNDEITMGTPMVSGTPRHGLTKVATTDFSSFFQLYNVKMKIADEFFESLSLNGIDFLKCDVEGYEFKIFSSMEKTLLKYKPLVQAELGGKENRIGTINLFSRLGYQPYLLKEQNLELANTKDIEGSVSDFYFIPIGNEKQAN